ncbi:MAG: PAS domain-containing protein [Actinobacteria bacterium]|nr:PAS domain-containing protein [Actinomycetota bacterium]MDI6830776.1 PAS domain-containing protein [Actinomycetota bacterium]
MRGDARSRAAAAAMAAVLLLVIASLAAAVAGRRAVTLALLIPAALCAAVSTAAARRRVRQPSSAPPRQSEGSVLLEAIPSPALLVSSRGTILEANRRAAEFIPLPGGALRSLAGRELDEVFMPPYFGAWTPALKRALESEVPLEIRQEQYYLEDYSGICRVWLSALPGDGGTHRVLVIIQDITQEAWERAALLEASEREAGVFEGVPVKIAVLDRNFRLVRCNQSMMRWILDSCGLDESRLPGLPALDIMPQEFRPDWKHILRRVLVEGRSFEQPRVHQVVGGAEFFHRVRLHPIMDESGNVHEALLLFEDVTEYVRLERRLAETTDYLNLLIESLNDGFYAMDAEGKFSFCNQAFLDMLGLRNSSDLFAKEPVDIVMPEEAPKIERMLERRRRGEKVFFETLLRRSDGSSLPVQISSAPLFRSGEFAGIVGIAHDLSERRRLQAMVEESHKYLEIAYEELSVLDKMKSDFIAIASHELRTPLSIIKGYADAFQFGELGELTPFQMDKIRIINARADQMTKIINDLLDITRMEEGRLVGERWPAPVEGLVLNAASEYEGRAQQAGLTLRHSVAEGLPAVSVDVWRIHQVLENLIGNAIKFTPPGGEIEVSARLAEDPDMVEMEVRDTGPGIPLEQQRKLFTMFYQIETDSTRSAGGLGLGLVISKGIVEGHGGRIWVESEPGRGSSFKFTLPVHREG